MMSGEEENTLKHFKVISLDGPKPENTHVMLNPVELVNGQVVVDNIVKFLSVKDLKNFRLVEKTLWLPAATKMLKKKGIIYFDGHYDEEEEPDEDEYRDMQHYLKNMSHFQTESYCLGKGAKWTECDKEYKTFFGKYGAGIIHLRFDYEYHSHFNVELFRKILQQVPNLEILDIRNMPVHKGIMTKFQEPIQITNDFINGDEPYLSPKDAVLPNLQNLKRIELWNYNAYPGKMSELFIEQLFQIGPNVNSIKIVDRYYNKIVTKVLNVISNMPDLIKNLKELEFDSQGCPTPADLNMLTEMKQLKLKILRLGVIWELNRNAGPLQALLNAQCKTLVELQFANVNDQVMPIQLPRFEKLERLELTTDRPNGAPFGFTFGRISYVDTFPKLKYLANRRSQIFFPHDCYTTNLTYSRMHSWDGKKFFTGMGGLWKDLFPEEGEPFHSLISLDIPYPTKLAGKDKFFLRLAKMFPNANNEMLNNLREGITIERPGYDKYKGKWVRSVDLLKEAVRWDLLPSHPTLNYSCVKRDYGFGNCKTTDEESKLLSVYTAAIKLFECTLNDLHDACISGTLADYLIGLYRMYDQLSNFYCVWFMQNLKLVNNPYPIPGRKKSKDKLVWLDL